MYLCAAAEHSKKICSKWPWTQCESKLSHLGFKLIFSADTARSQRAWITRPSNVLLEVDARKVNLDIANGVISLADMDAAEIATYNLQISEAKKKKRKCSGDQVAASDLSINVIQDDCWLSN